MSKIDPKTHDLVMKWVILLGNLTGGKMSAEEARIKSQAYTAILAAEYPATAFNEKSCAFVAGKCTFFPSYGEVARALTEFLRPKFDDVFPVFVPSPPPTVFVVKNRERPPDDPNASRQGPSQAEMDIVSGYVAQIKLDMARNRSEAVVMQERISPARLTPDQLAIARCEAGIVIPNPSPL